MSTTYEGVIFERLSVDVSQQNEFAPRLVKQGDAYTRGYIITLTKDGEPLIISTTNTTVWFNCRNKTDPTKRASAEGTINADGTVTVKVPTVVMEVAGYIQCDISIITVSGNDTNILKSTLFTLICEASANPDGTTTEAEDSILVGIAAGTIVPPAGPYVPKTRTVAGNALSADITAADLITALGIKDAVIEIDAETSAQWDDDIPTDYDGEGHKLALYLGALWYLSEIDANDNYIWYELATVEDVNYRVNTKMDYAHLGLQEA
ncbi:MAG: BppU family phage baseplate upper protein, partial [Ruminococcus sp.]|nr:BppU family phage baseplate upper protein [Ruminococcus sp.]